MLLHVKKLLKRHRYWLEKSSSIMLSLICHMQKRKSSCFLDPTPTTLLLWIPHLHFFLSNPFIHHHHSGHRDGLFLLAINLGNEMWKWLTKNWVREVKVEGANLEHLGRHTFILFLTSTLITFPIPGSLHMFFLGGVKAMFISCN